MSEPTPVTEYAVLPRKWKVLDHPRLGRVVAAMMPYPVLHPEDAACLNDPAWIDETVMFSGGAGPGSTGTRDTVQGAYMRSVCGRCPLRVACAEYGIAHEGALMFGGLTPSERAAIRKERRQVLVEPHAAYVYGLDEDPHVYVLNLNASRDTDDAEG